MAVCESRSVMTILVSRKLTYLHSKQIRNWCGTPFIVSVSVCKRPHHRRRLHPNRDAVSLNYNQHNSSPASSNQRSPSQVLPTQPRRAKQPLPHQRHPQRSSVQQQLPPRQLRRPRSPHLQQQRCRHLRRRPVQLLQQLQHHMLERRRL